MPKKKAKAKGRPQADSPSGPIYPLKITLAGVTPAIWRRVETPDCSLAKLHDIIQVCMGWEDRHLHLFAVGGKRFGLRKQWKKELDSDQDSRKVRLGQFVAQGVNKFHYAYDMGDGWDHSIVAEKILTAEPGVKYPRCVGGERACPPEDCGGTSGYGDFLEAIHDPDHERHEELLEWGGDFNPDEFDPAEVNKQLMKLR